MVMYVACSINVCYKNLMEIFANYKNLDLTH